MLGRYISLGQPVANHPLNEGLVEWWLPLPNNQGGGTLFGLRNRAHGTLTSAPTWGPGPNGFGTISTNGSSSYVDCGTPPGLNGASAATLVGTVYRASTGVTAGFGGAAGSSGMGNSRFSLIWFSDGNLYFAAENGGQVYGHVALAGTGWHRLAMVFDGSGADNPARLKLYIDGAAQTVTFDAGTVPATLGTVAPLLIGKDSSDRFCAGSYESVRLHNRALSATEVAGLYQQSLRGYPDTLRRLTRAAWSFGGGGGAPAATLHNLALLGVGG